MGEWSKKIGDLGEDIIKEFLTMIAWSDSQENLPIPCIKKQKHSDDGKLQTHGIDYLFSYESQLSNRSVEHLVISVKYTSKPYPASPSSKFKEFFFDLAKTLECFKNSKSRQDLNKQFSGVDHARDSGVLFWLSNDQTTYDDLISRIASVRGMDDYQFGSIYIVDNQRISFIYDSISLLKLKYKNSEIEFFYQTTGKNYNPTNRKVSGKILPVEFINSSILLIKVISKDNKNTFVISTIENFHEDRLKRLIGLAYDITSDFPEDTLILFPDYDRLTHINMVKEAKSSFRDKRFTEKIKIDSYNGTFRSLGNE